MLKAFAKVIPVTSVGQPVPALFRTAALARKKIGALAAGVGKLALFAVAEQMAFWSFVQGFQ
jgi:hypothetical protein